MVGEERGGWPPDGPIRRRGTIVPVGTHTRGSADRSPGKGSPRTGKPDTGSRGGRPQRVFPRNESRGAIAPHDPPLRAVGADARRDARRAAVSSRKIGRRV